MLSYFKLSLAVNHYIYLTDYSCNILTPYVVKTFSTCFHKYSSPFIRQQLFRTISTAISNTVIFLPVFPIGLEHFAPNTQEGKIKKDTVKYNNVIHPSFSLVFFVFYYPIRSSLAFPSYEKQKGNKFSLLT